MALLLKLRARIKSKTFTNPSLLHMFSTSNSGDDKPEPSGDSAASDHQSATNFKSPFSSYFSDVKDSLKQRQPTASQPRKSPTFSFASSGGTSPPASTLEDIRKNLSEFRRRTSAPPPGDPSSPQVSFQELYKRNVLDKSGESTGNASLGPGKAAGGSRSFDALRQSIGKLQSSGGSPVDRKGVDRMSLSAFRDSLKLKPSDSVGSATSSRVIGGTGALPASIFGREMREKKEGESSARMKPGLMRPYTFEKLGEKLRELRPEAKGKEWFSLGELNERLVKLMEMDERDAESAIRWVSYKDLKDTLNLLNDDAKKPPLQRLDILGRWGKTPTYMLEPPKEHLVEKYFHPDNMSSAEKLKIELTKVRDEFKMSESDCGSARVQVAQLTTKIKHLSSVLHKKDVHSRKGLLAMVQRRKRLLKYLRRTDWDSYCFVISKLGLRDNPDNVSGGARSSKSTKKISKKRKLSSAQKA